jgi:osmoprotectant transport system ATP-binding protein
MSVIEVKNLYKAYDDNNWVLKDVNFTIEAGEFIVMVGASGCGKTTMLKLVNKLIPLSKGYIYYHDKDICHWNTDALRRSIGYVIQQIGLFPHMTIEKNIIYPLDIMRKEDIAFKKKRAKELIELVGLSPTLLSKYPRQLSGGQAQRIGVARALAADPDVILMDEPFGAVDEITRTNLQVALKDIQQKLKKTILFVTHDIEEALKLGDRIMLFKDGEIVQIGHPNSLVFSPENAYVQDFFGLKGFKATLDYDVMNAAYQDILSGKSTLKDFYSKLSK